MRVLSLLLELMVVAGIASVWLTTRGTALCLAVTIVLSLSIAFVIARRFPARSPWRTVAAHGVFWLTAIIGTFASLSAWVIAGIESLSFRIDVRELAYEEYCRRFGTSGFDPEGASDISVAYYKNVDSYDEFLHLRMCSDAYRQLRSREDARWDDPAWTAPPDKLLGAPTKSAPPRGTPAKRRVTPLEAPPTWWLPPVEGDGLEYTVWHVRYMNANREKGSWWLYDESNETLWIWNWNHQWAFLDPARPE